MHLGYKILIAIMCYNYLSGFHCLQSSARPKHVPHYTEGHEDVIVIMARPKHHVNYV